MQVSKIALRLSFPLWSGTLLIEFLTTNIRVGIDINEFLMICSIDQIIFYIEETSCQIFLRAAYHIGKYNCSAIFDYLHY